MEAYFDVIFQGWLYGRIRFRDLEKDPNNYDQEYCRPLIIPVRNLWEDTKILPTQIMAEKLE